MTLPGQDHNKPEKSERYTPPWIIDIARRTLGDIDLDPCSCALAQEYVQATRFISLPKDGLSFWWGDDRVFCNPPGGRGNAMKWLRKCYGHGAPFFFVGFNLQQLPDALKILRGRGHISLTTKRPHYWEKHPDEKINSNGKRPSPYGHSYLVSNLPIVDHAHLVQLR